jgi:hypothetical protein
MSYEIFYYKYIYIDLDTSEGIEIPDKKKSFTWEARE